MAGSFTNITVEEKYNSNEMEGEDFVYIQKYNMLPQKKYTDVDRNYIARLNSDGTLDMTFEVKCVSGHIKSIVIQSDGKILVGGDISSIIPKNGYLTSIRGNIAKLNSNGTLDTTFDLGIVNGNYVYSIMIQSDGKILIGGEFTSIKDVKRNNLARLNSDGTLDKTFDPGESINGAVYFITDQPDGKILAGGSFTTIAGGARNYITRFNSNGTLDTTFKPMNQRL
jgi:uncharacterized delta-60 repeat protein